MGVGLAEAVGDVVDGADGVGVGRGERAFKVEVGEDFDAAAGLAEEDAGAPGPILEVVAPEALGDEAAADAAGEVAVGVVVGNDFVVAVGVDGVAVGVVGGLLRRSAAYRRSGRRLRLSIRRDHRYNLPAEPPVYAEVSVERKHYATRVLLGHSDETRIRQRHGNVGIARH